jgi:hypothetical protein
MVFEGVSGDDMIATAFTVYRYGHFVDSFAGRPLKQFCAAFQPSGGKDRVFGGFFI